MEHEYEFTIVLERDEDGAVIATVPALPGCHTAGDTESEALALIQDAIRLHIEARLELGEPILEDLGATRVRVAV
ncbi:MAG TPA: type II toxin-antitoxin system HicB family antitoxin [Chloroflexota bacterium]|nr:type II toxin-antitoxin system HicB family antitoxin [Chloroflexota bacterium]